jgi:hypothetical protein
VPCRVFLYTTAPEVCDLPGTHTVYAPVGATTQGDLVRIVAVPLLVFLQQWKRYTVRGHLVTEITSWHALVQHGWVELRHSAS